MPDLPALTHEGVCNIDPFSRQVFPEFPVDNRPADLGLPPPLVLDRVRVDCFVRATMSPSIGLIVSSQIDAAGHDAPANRKFPDRALGLAPFVIELPDSSDIDRQDAALNVLHRLLPLSKLVRACSLPLHAQSAYIM